MTQGMLYRMMKRIIQCIALGVSFTGLGVVSSRATQSDATEIANSLVSEIRNSLPPSAAPMSRADVAVIGRGAGFLLNSSYFPVDTEAARAASLQAVKAAASGSATVASLTEAAMRALVAAVGHGASITISGARPAEQGAAEVRPLRRTASTAVIDLRNIHFEKVGWESRCESISALLYANLGPNDQSAVLDLRGNEGGQLQDIACIASLFVLEPVRLFQADMRGESESFESKPVAGVLQTLPIAIAIDARTDSGGLLLAAVLQDRGRGAIIGVQKQPINGVVYNLLPLPPVGQVTVPFGEIKHGREAIPLSKGVRVDVPVSDQDEAGLMREATARLRTP